jgi:hypothetical protein
VVARQETRPRSTDRKRTTNYRTICGHLPVAILLDTTVAAAASDADARSVHRRATLIEIAAGLTLATLIALLAQMPRIDWHGLAGGLTHSELLVAITIVAGIAGLIVGTRPDRPQRPDEVHRVNRRALAILPAAAVALAVLLQLVADHGLVPLVALAAYGSFFVYAAIGVLVARNHQRLLAGAGRLVSRLRSHRQPD